MFFNRKDLLEKTGQLVLTLPENWPEQRGVVQWHWQDGERFENGAVETLAELSIAHKTASLHVWTPAADTRLTRVNVPSKDRRTISKALPFLLEDGLLEKPSSVHFAQIISPPSEISVGVTAKARMSSWLEALKAQEFFPQSLCPVTLRVPVAETTWSFDAASTCVRTGLVGGFACDLIGSEIPLTLITALHESREAGVFPTSLVVFSPPASLNFERWSAHLDLPVVKGSSDAFVPASPAAPVNLLQGAFAPPASWKRRVKEFLPALSLLAVWLTLNIVFQSWDLLRLSHREKLQRAEMTRLFKTAFPDAKAVVDPALQMARNFSSMKGQAGQLGASDALSMMERVTRAMGPINVEIVRLQYENGALTLTAELPNFQELEKLKQSLSGVFKLEILSAESAADRVVARFKVS